MIELRATERFFYIEHLWGEEPTQAAGGVQWPHSWLYLTNQGPSPRVLVEWFTSSAFVTIKDCSRFNWNLKGWTFFKISVSGPSLAMFGDLPSSVLESILTLGTVLSKGLNPRFLHAKHVLLIFFGGGGQSSNALDLLLAQRWPQICLRNHIQHQRSNQRLQHARRVPVNPCTISLTLLKKVTFKRKKNMDNLLRHFIIVVLLLFTTIRNMVSGKLLNSQEPQFTY